MSENAEFVVRPAYGGPAWAYQRAFSTKKGSTEKSTHRVVRATRGRRNGTSATVLTDQASRMRRPLVQLRRAVPAVHAQAMCSSNASRTHSSA